MHVPVAAPVDIALYDTFAQPQGDSETVRELLANPRVSRVVVYTWNFQEALTLATLGHGVSGYLSKSLTAAELADALRSVARGEIVTSPDPGRLSLVGGDWPGREEGLTARESEVLALITQGLSNTEIADRTCLSINSIKSHIRSAYRKIACADPSTGGPVGRHARVSPRSTAHAPETADAGRCDRAQNLGRGGVNGDVAGGHAGRRRVPTVLFLLLVRFVAHHQPDHQQGREDGKYPGNHQRKN